MSEDGRNRSNWIFQNLKGLLHGLLWLICPPLYAIGVLFRDFTVLQKILRVASIFLSPFMWGFSVLGGLYLASYLDEKDREDRIEMA